MVRGKGQTIPGSTPFKKGQSGNPNGRPKGRRNKSTIIKKFLEAVRKQKNPISGELENLQIQEQMVLAQIANALKGDTKAFKELMDGAYGMNTQKIEQDIEHKQQVIINRTIIKKD